MNNDNGFRSRKFALAAFAMLCSAAGMLTELLDGNAWYLSIAVILGMYGAANVAAKKAP